MPSSTQDDEDSLKGDSVNLKTERSTDLWDRLRSGLYGHLCYPTLPRDILQDKNVRKRGDMTDLWWPFVSRSSLFGT